MSFAECTIIGHWTSGCYNNKVIWLEYKDIKNKFKWIFVSELTYATDLISNFHIIYPAKPSSPSLF